MDRDEPSEPRIVTGLVLAACLPCAVAAAQEPYRRIAIPAPVVEPASLAGLPTCGHHGCTNTKHYRVAPLPLGASVYAVNRTQVVRGTMARMMLRDFDFRDGTAELKPEGLARLAWIAAESARTPGYIRIEATPRAVGLDQARRAAVALELARIAPAILPDRLVVDRDTALGLKGPETQLIDAAQLGRTAAEGPAVGDSTGPGAFAGGAPTPGLTTPER